MSNLFCRIVEVDGLENSRALIDNAEWVALVGNGHSASQLVKWVFDNLGETVSHSAMKRAARACRRQPGYVGLPAPITGIGIPCIGVEQETSTRPECASQQRIVETVEDNGNSRIITIPKTQICTLQGVIEYCNIDTSTWDIPRHIINKWDMGYKTEEGADALPLFQVKVWLEKKVEVVAVKAEIEALIEIAKLQMPRFPAIIHKRNQKSHLVVPSIFDAHLGKKATKANSGADWNMDTGIKEYEDTIDDLIYKTRNMDADRIMIPLGNDLFHMDNSKNKTYGDTQMDCDGNFHDNYKRITRLMIETILKLREIAPTDALCVSGNHDRDSVFTMGHALELFFDKVDDVTILNSGNTHEAYTYGKVFLCMFHGEKGKLPEVSAQCQSKYGEVFGKCKTHEALLGHIHTLEEKPVGGFVVRRMPSIAPNDRWHQDNWYGSRRGGVALCYDRELWQATVGSMRLIDELTPIMAR